LRQLRRGFLHQHRLLSSGFIIIIIIIIMQATRLFVETVTIASCVYELQQP
jgi:hypothetical protein